jgi:hypothetical protein
MSWSTVKQSQGSSPTVTLLSISAVLEGRRWRPRRINTIGKRLTTWIGYLEKSNWKNRG